LKYGICPFFTTVPNSLFSRTIVTMCWKRGTSDGAASVAVSVGLGTTLGVADGAAAAVALGGGALEAGGRIVGTG
jgi:hypothetical protein